MALRQINLGHGQLAAVFQCVAPPGIRGRYAVQHDRYLAVPVPPYAIIDFTDLCKKVEGELDTHEPKIALQKTEWEKYRTSTTAVYTYAVGHKITVAHLGDSRATLFIYNPKDRSVRGIALTTDHNTRNQNEVNRALKYGAEITDNGTYFGEVIDLPPDSLRGLVRKAFSRGFGDRLFSEWFLAVPEVATFDLTEDPFLLRSGEIPLLALDTDGIHCDLSAEQRAKILQHNIREGRVAPTPIALADHFAKAAIQKKSPDNMTALVSGLTLNRRHGHVLAVFDGAGSHGYLSANAAMELSLQYLRTLPSRSLIRRVLDRFPNTL